MDERWNTQRAGMAGEFHVMSVLWRLGYTPMLTLGNAKSVDIVCECPANSGRFVKIDVKSSQGAHNWPVASKKNLTLDEKSGSPLYFALLDFEKIKSLQDNPKVWIVPANHIRRFMRDWQGSTWAIYRKDFPRLMEAYADGWLLLEKDHPDTFNAFPEPEHILEYLTLGDDTFRGPIEVTVEFLKPDGSTDAARTMPELTASEIAFQWLQAAWQSGVRQYMSFDEHPYRVQRVGPIGRRSELRRVIRAVPLSPEDVARIGSDWKTLSMRDASGEDLQFWSMAKSKTAGMPTIPAGAAGK